LTNDIAGQKYPVGIYAGKAARHRAGRPISQFDAQIAATARSLGASLATRDTGGFEECGVDLINPWIAGGETKSE
jgi:predicted nucleic acid-binding protein